MARTKEEQEYLDLREGANAVQARDKSLLTPAKISAEDLAALDKELKKSRKKPIRLVGDSLLPPDQEAAATGSWTLQIVPGLMYRVPEGSEPNCFHRWMQRICFGFRWTKNG